jgi:acyl dehydratase/putative sterol carrier protein
MMKQNYGRIINTASAVGLYGNFGQANYSTAKAGILGLSTSLAQEGKKNNVLVNVIAPNAGTAMTATILPQEIVDMLKPDYVAPLVGFLGHESNQHCGSVFEVGSGWFSQVHWQRSGGYRLDTSRPVSVEDVASNWTKFNSFDGKVDYPNNAQESFSSIIAMLSSRRKSASGGGNSFEFTKRDVMLYNLGVGCTEKELKYVYEGSPEFAAIPTFGVIPAFVIMMDAKMEEYASGYNPAMLLHGEHYLEVIKPLPVQGKLRSERNVLQVLPKGKGCIVVLQLKTFDEQGDLLTINEGTIFLRNATPKKTVNNVGERQKLSLETPTIPDRQPDKVVKQKIPNNQAAIYRLSGDYNPLHVDDAFAKMGGFSKPILHGLCSYGHAAQHVLKAFAGDNPALFKAIKARFTKHVFPGETIQTEMWKISPNRIAFQVRVLERDDIVIGNAFVELHSNAHQSAATGSKAAALFSQYEKIYSSLPPAMKEDQVKKVNGLFQFDVKEGNETVSYFIDLKNSPGKIGMGKAVRPDITIIVKDDDFAELAAGKITGQQAFMKGKVQVRGDMMLAMKLDRVLKALSANTKSKM